MLEHDNKKYISVEEIQIQAQLLLDEYAGLDRSNLAIHGAVLLRSAGIVDLYTRLVQLLDPPVVVSPGNPESDQSSDAPDPVVGPVPEDPTPQPLPQAAQI